MLTFFIGSDSKALAASQTIAFGRDYSATVEKGVVNKYYFTCTKAGRVTINLDVTDGRACWALYDSDLELLRSAANYSTSSCAVGSNRYVIDLEPGRYELDIWESWPPLAYTVNVQFTSANETYSYENDMYIDVADKAAIPFKKKITGQFAVNDEVDYYKLVVPADGKVTYAVSNKTDSRIIMDICDSQGTAIAGNNFWVEEGSHNYFNTLKKGIYYLRFDSLDKSDSDTGTYYFTIGYEMDMPTSVSAKASGYTSLKVTAKGSGSITGYRIRYKRGSGSYKTVIVKGNKNLSKTLKVVPGTYRVQVQSYCTLNRKNYYSPWSGTKTVNCEVKKPIKLSVKNSSSKALKITAKRGGTVTGYQIRYKKGSGSYKTVTIKGNKSLNMTIKKLKKGSTYKVQVRAYYKYSGKNYYSAWSTTKSVKIRK